MRLPAFLLMLLTAGLSLASIPYVPIKADFHNQEPQFEIIGRTLNTPIVRAQFYQGTNYFDPTGLSAYLSFGKDAYSTQMVVVTGVVYAGTTSNTGYADFHISSNTFAYPVNQWYASVMLTDTATAQVYSMAYGYLTIKPAPEVDATHSFFYTRAINGDEYGPFTGSFTNWPFVLSGEFLGGYVAISNWNASNTVLQLQIDVNKTGKVDLVTYTAFAAAQANTNAGFESRIAGEEVKSIAQANTNAGFETRIVANSTGKVSQATYDAHVSAQANTNAGFETRIVANDTGKVSLVTYNLHTAAQANTNAGFESRIAGEEVKSTAQVNTNAGFESRIGIEEGKSTAQANTNAGFETRITDNSTGKVSLVTYTAHAAAQVNTNAGFESRIAGEEVKSTAQANTNAAFEMRIQEGEEAYSWGDHADEGYLTAGTNLFGEMTIAKRSMLGANISGLTQGVYTGVVSGVSFTGVTELVYGRTYAWGFTKQNAYGTSTLSIASYSLVATAAGAASNYFTFIGTDTNLVLKLDGDGSSKSDVSAVYVRQITGGVANVAGDLRVGGDIILDGAILDFSDFVDATITNDLSGRVDVLSTSKVSHTDSIYTDTVAKAVAAYDWGDHAEEGYLTNEPSWTAASGSVVYVTDSTYTDTVAKAAAAVTTNDTRQLDFTGADVRVADGTATNHPVTKSQLDANSGTTNATGINVAFAPTNYTPDDPSVEGHLIGIDAVVASGSGSGFPLTNHGDLAGFNLTNGGLVQAVSGEFENVEMWTNSTIAPTGAVYAPLASFMSVSNSVGILITNTATAAQGTKADAAMPAPAGAIVGDMLRFNGTNWTAIPETVLIADRTIYFSSAQTVSEMQSAIDSVPRNLNGYNLYLAFSNGTYSLTDTLYVKNFKNGSTIFCTTSLTYSTLTVPYTNQPVKIQNNGLHTPVVRFDNCDDLKIYDINFHYANTYTNKIAVTTVGCSVAPFACMFSGVTTTAVNNIIGLVAQRSTFDMRACQFNNVKYGFQNSAAGIASIQASASGPVKPIADIFSATAVTMLNQTGLVTSVAAGGIVVNVAGATLP